MIYVIDTETTGREPPEVIELAYGLLDLPSLTIKDIPVWLRYKPNLPSTFEALATHHILESELSLQPPSSDATLPPEAQYIVGHNVDYDWEALGKPPVRRICTLAISRTLFPEDGHKLGAMVYRLWHSQQEARTMLREAHSALADVEFCVLVLKAMATVKGLSWASPEDLWQFSEKCRVPTIVTFGKHKGLPVKNLPRDYVAWCRRQPDMDPYFLKALKEHFR